jgi:hypothetical protein
MNAWHEKSSASQNVVGWSFYNTNKMMILYNLPSHAFSCPHFFPVGGRAAGVNLRGGHVMRARKAVISNASIWDTMKLIPR